MLFLALSGCWIVTPKEVCEHRQDVGDELTPRCAELLGLEEIDTNVVETDTDTDADSDADTDADSDADTDTSATAETGDTVTVSETGSTADTGIYLGQLCLEVTPLVGGNVDVYVFETGFDNPYYWVDPVATPVVPNNGVVFTSGDASALICGDMALVPYATGHNLLILGIWSNGTEQSLVEGNSSIGYTSQVVNVSLSGQALTCFSYRDVAVAPYAYTSCVLP